MFDGIISTSSGLLLVKPPEDLPGRQHMELSPFFFSLINGLARALEAPRHVSKGTRRPLHSPWRVSRRRWGPSVSESVPLTTVLPVAILDAARVVHMVQKNVCKQQGRQGTRRTHLIE